MFKKLSIAAALLCCAAISPAAYADGLPSAIGNVAHDAADTGRDIMDGAENIGRDILNGFTADDTNTGGGIGSSARTADPGSGGTANYSGTANDTTSNSTDSISSNNSDSLASGSTSSEAAGGNPDTGISMGYVASAAVLSAMGVVVTAIKRRDD